MVTFRVGPLWPYLEARIGTGLCETPQLVAKRDLERYYTLLMSQGAREVLDLHLSQTEASAVCDAMNGGVFTAAGSDVLGHGPPVDMLGSLVAELTDADRLRNLGAQWEVDVSSIITRLRTLTPLGQYYLCDALERFWRGRDETVEEVGLCQ
jgi:hypothetical protein